MYCFMVDTYYNYKNNINSLEQNIATTMDTPIIFSVTYNIKRIIIKIK